MHTERIAVYPGTFDPITNGHVHIVQRGLQVVDRIIIAPGINPGKNPMLTVEDRVGLIQTVFAGEPRVRVVPFNGLLVDFLEQVGASLVLRGLRTTGDFESELTMALVNRKLSPEVETICLMTEEQDFCTSSTVVRTLYKMGGEYDQFVPKQVAEYLRSKWVRENGLVSPQVKNSQTKS